MQLAALSLKNGLDPTAACSVYEQSGVGKWVAFRYIFEQHSTARRGSANSWYEMNLVPEWCAIRLGGDTDGTDRADYSPTGN